MEKKMETQKKNFDNKLIKSDKKPKPNPSLQFK